MISYLLWARPVSAPSACAVGNGRQSCRQNRPIIRFPTLHAEKLDSWGPGSYRYTVREIMWGRHGEKRSWPLRGSKVTGLVSATASKLWLYRWVKDDGSNSALFYSWQKSWIVYGFINLDGPTFSLRHFTSRSIIMRYACMTCRFTRWPSRFFIVQHWKAGRLPKAKWMTVCIIIIA